LPAGARGAKGPLDYDLAQAGRDKDRHTALSLAVFHAWCFLAPVAAYVILQGTYADFCKASSDADKQKRLCTAPHRAPSLLAGIDGVLGSDCEEACT
jgi:hypothetical protein